MFATIREPISWAMRRIEQHANTLICREELWDEPSVFHPFDIIGCLLLKEKPEVESVISWFISPRRRLQQSLS